MCVCRCACRCVRACAKCRSNIICVLVPLLGRRYILVSSTVFLSIHYLYPLSTIHYLYPLSTILIVHRRHFPKTPYSFKNMLIFYLCSQCLHRTSISMPRIKTNLVLYIPLLASRGLILPLYRPDLYNYVCIILYLAGKWLPGVHRKGT